MQAARGASLSDAVPPSTESTARPKARLRALFATIAVLGLAIDQGTKSWALHGLREGDVEVVGRWFVLHLTFNPGAAFSTGTDFTIVFTGLAMLAVVVVLWLSRRVASTGWGVALGLLLGGVGGNLTDRIVRDPEPFHGHVVDFLMLPNWPVFNVADICINVAAGLIILQTFRGVALDGSRDRDSTPLDSAADPDQ